MGDLERFHQQYYDHRDSWLRNTWQGIRVHKSPLDLWAYQEMIWELKPDLIIETGTKFGGSALFFAHMLDLVGQGRVISIDTRPQDDLPEHPRIQYHVGSSTSLGAFRAVRAALGRTVLVSLDSNHEARHVQKELWLYSRFVRPGGLLVVEDTNLNGNPVRPDFGPGPHEAVERFLARNRDWAPETRWEARNLLSFNPGGVLRRFA